MLFLFAICDRILQGIIYKFRYPSGVRVLYALELFTNPKMVLISVLLAVIEGTISAWFSVAKAIFDFSIVCYDFFKEEDVVKKVSAMVVNGVCGVTYARPVSYFTAVSAH